MCVRLVVDVFLFGFVEVEMDCEGLVVVCGVDLVRLGWLVKVNLVLGIFMV